MKISPVGGELFNEDGHNETKSRFSQFGKRAYILAKHSVNGNAQAAMRS
jgi:hypothetical protein